MSAPAVPVTFDIPNRTRLNLPRSFVSSTVQKGGSKVMVSICKTGHTVFTSLPSELMMDGLKPTANHVLSPAVSRVGDFAVGGAGK